MNDRTHADNVALVRLVPAPDLGDEALALRVSCEATITMWSPTVAPFGVVKTMGTFRYLAIAAHEAACGRCDLRPAMQEPSTKIEGVA